MLNRHGDTGLVCVVSTVKDTKENLDRFVERNLAGGADHLFVYVDDADEATYQHLARHRHVTAVRTGAGYWHGQRPRSLNRRQWVNANLTNVLLTAFPEVSWLFHLDGDEELDLDRSRLLSLPPEVEVVRLGTRESVASVTPERGAGLFKRQLEPGELALLTMLGAVPRPSNKAYFHGHTAGKSGVRPSLGLRLAVHRVDTADRVEVEPLREPWLNVLHHDSWSPEEFARKWTEHLNPENTATFRSRKERLRAALATVVRLDLPDEQRRELVLDLYRRHVADDVELLDRLGFLVRPERSWHRHRPGRFHRTARGDLEELLGRLRALDKREHFDKPSYQPRQVVAAVLDGLERTSLRERVGKVLSASRA